jgi:hypothetical protein
MHIESANTTALSHYFPRVPLLYNFILQIHSVQLHVYMKMKTPLSARPANHTLSRQSDSAHQSLVLFHFRP